MPYKKALLFSLLVAAGVFAADPVVERFTLSPLEPGKFHRYPRAALNTRSKQTLIVFEKHPGNHPAHNTWACVYEQGLEAGNAGLDLILLRLNFPL